jgi:hypothetical protein
MAKKRTLPKSFTGTTQMPDAPPLPAARRKHSVPPAKGAPVPPPPLWNYEPKEGQAPAPSPKHAGATDARKAPEEASARFKEDADAKKAQEEADARKAREDAEDTAALAETGAALDGLSEQLALLEALVARLPE